MNDDLILVNGFPTSFIASRIVKTLLAREPAAKVVCVVEPKHSALAEERLAQASEEQRKRLVLLEGDCAAMDLGLSGAEYRDLTENVRVIHHCAAVTYLGADPQVAERANVQGAREVLELAHTARDLRRLVHWSTALVSGAKHGRVFEDDLDGTSGFRNPIEKTRHRAERIIREAMGSVPTTILRPGIVVGDSTNGEIDRFDGPYLLVLVVLNSPADLSLPMPGRGSSPLHLVPVDYVLEAGFRIVDDPRSVGRTFHIVDPNPLPAKQVFEKIAQSAGRPVPRGYVPAHLAAALLRTPGLERYAHAPRSFLEQLSTEVTWDDRNTREILEGTGIVCPSFDTYVGTMVEYVRKQQAVRRARQAEEMLEDSSPLE